MGRSDVVAQCAASYCPKLSQHELALCEPTPPTRWEPAFYAFSQVVLAKDLNLSSRNPATGQLGVNLAKHLDSTRGVSILVQLKQGAFAVDGGEWQDATKVDLTPSICQRDQKRVVISIAPGTPDYEAGYYISRLKSCDKIIELRNPK